MVVSDCHSGLVRAIQEQFQGASWQRCPTHLTRNILSAVPKHLQPEIHSRLRSIFTASDLETARILLNATLDSYEDQVPKAMETLENEFDDAVAVFTLPERYRRKLRTPTWWKDLIRKSEDESASSGYSPMWNQP